jgi:hypothetical protein
LEAVADTSWVKGVNQLPEKNWVVGGRGQFLKHLGLVNIIGNNISIKYCKISTLYFMSL